MVNAVPLPPDSALANPERPYDYADSYAAPVADSSLTAADAAAAFFGRAPRWISFLMSVRNRIVSVFGLKTGKDNPTAPTAADLTVGQTVGLFRVYQASPSEVILGEDDRHLNFRVSVLVRPPDPTGRLLIVSTVVHYRNVFGRLYFFFVRPIHRLIVPAMFRRMLARAQAHINVGHDLG